MTLIAECRRMAELLPGAPAIADLLRRAAAELEAPRKPSAEALRANFDAGAYAMAKAAAAQVMATKFETLEGRP